MSEEPNPKDENVNQEIPSETPQEQEMPSTPPAPVEETVAPSTVVENVVPTTPPVEVLPKPVETPIRISRIMLFNVSITAPDPISKWSITIPVVNRDMLAARGFIEEYKSYFASVQEEWRREIASRFNISENKRTTKITEHATIIHSGRKEAARIRIVIHTMPSLLYTTVSMAKNIVYSYVWNNAIVMGRRPQSLFLLPEAYVPTLHQRLSNANAMIEEINAMAGEIFSEAIKPKILELLQKYNWFGGVEVPIELKKLHPIVLKLYPIVFDQEILAKIIEKTPEAKEILETSFREFITDILRDIHNRLRPIVESYMIGKGVRHETAIRKIEKATEKLKSIGLEALAEQVRTLYIDLITKPESIRQYTDWNALVDSINARLLSL